MRIDFERPLNFVELSDYFHYSEDFVGQFSSHRPDNEFYDGQIGFLRLPEIDKEGLKEHVLECLVERLNEYEKGYEIFGEKAWSDVDLTELSVQLHKGASQTQYGGRQKAKLFTYDKQTIIPAYKAKGQIQYARIEPTGVQDTLRVLRNDGFRWNITPTTKEVEDELLKCMDSGFGPGFALGYNLGDN